MTWGISGIVFQTKVFTPSIFRLTANTVGPADPMVDSPNGWVRNEYLYLILSTRYSELNTQYSILGTQHSILRTPYSVLGTRYSALSTQHSKCSRFEKFEKPCYALICGKTASFPGFLLIFGFFRISGWDNRCPQRLMLWNDGPPPGKLNSNALRHDQLESICN